MKNIALLNIGVLLVLFQLVKCTPDNDTNTVANSRTSFDFDWKFELGDDSNAKNVAFDDSDWRNLDLPHDWSIEGEYDENNPAGIAGAYLPTGIGWYRKDLVIDNLQEDDRYFIDFDGVYMNSDVYVNGKHLGNRPYGYISFSYDLSDYLKEGKNTIAVRVDNEKSPSGRWYTGTGIYRHVWLRKTKDVYTELWGASVSTPEINIEKKEALVSYENKIINSSDSERNLLVESEMLDANSNIIAKKTSELTLKDSILLKEEFNINNAEFWSPDSPVMYTVKTSIYEDGKILNQTTTPFGIRSIELKANKGFLLNGEAIKFKGLSNHHDAGALGSAVPDDVLYQRLKLLKDMGCNALRTTHNPFAPEFYTMCDTMGIMVMDEAFDGWWTKKAEFDYGLYFAEWWKRDLEDFIKRDRNHPSVVIWSIGNEVRNFTAEQQKEIVEFAKTIDATRPYTQGRGYSAPYIDIAGFNGHGEMRGVLEKFHKNNPEKLIIGTEITHTLQTRGVYRTKTWYRTKDNPAPWEKPAHFKKMEPKVYKIPHLTEEEVFTGVTKKYQSSYDNSIVRIGVRDDWNRVEAMDYYIGNFRWTGFDYLGESFGWPARTANFGIIDLAGIPKDHYYLYQSLWSSKPMVHILPHWTHPGKEGVEIPIVVYTNCESAELFLNGKSLGEKEMGAERQLVWNVAYQKGELKAVAKTKDGKTVEKAYLSAEEVKTLNLKVDKTVLRANKTDVVRLEVSSADAKGTFNPNANNLVELEISGPAKMIGAENGDILDLSPHKVNTRKLFNGKCVFYVQTTDEAGSIQLKVKSENLDTALIELESK